MSAIPTSISKEQNGKRVNDLAARVVVVGAACQRCPARLHVLSLFVQITSQVEGALITPLRRDLSSVALLMMRLNSSAGNFGFRHLEDATGLFRGESKTAQRSVSCKGSSRPVASSYMTAQTKRGRYADPAPDHALAPATYRQPYLLSPGSVKQIGSAPRIASHEWKR